MPALSALPNQPVVPSSSYPWAASASSSCVMSGVLSWSAFALVIAMAVFVTTAMATRRRHWSWHSPAAAPSPSTVETKVYLDSNWRQSPLAQSTSAQASVPLLPVPTIRRSSYPPAGGGNFVSNTRSRPKERTLTKSDFGIGITRQDIIEEIQGRRRHTMVVGRLEDTERQPPL